MTAQPASQPASRPTTYLTFPEPSVLRRHSPSRPLAHLPRCSCLLDIRRHNASPRAAACYPLEGDGRLGSQLACIWAGPGNLTCTGQRSRSARARATPHHTTPHHTTPHPTAPHRTAPHRTAPHRTTPLQIWGHDEHRQPHGEHMQGRYGWNGNGGRGGSTYMGAGGAAHVGAAGRKVQMSIYFNLPP